MGHPVLVRPDYTCHGNGIAFGNENLPIADCQRQSSEVTVREKRELSSVLVHLTKK